jgi:hypothetical protein
VLNEGDIKAAVIDKLFGLNALSNAVLINEMVVANWSRRADLVVANGKLHAFEIKSDLDNLRRLEGQLETYLDRFDKVTVVSTPKFVTLVKEVADPRVEVWCANETSHGITISIVRRGTSSVISNKRILCGYLLKAELVSLLVNEGRDAKIEMSRNELEIAVDELSVKAIRAFVLAALKRRYRETFELFCKNRSSCTQPNDLTNLSKLKARIAACEELERIEIHQETPNTALLNLTKLVARFGPLPPEMPLFVRKRATS